MNGFTSLGHVGIRVRDIERSLAFYTGKLGFAEMLRLHLDDGGLWLVYLRITDEQYLELFPEATGDRAPAPEANGLNHICLTVEDIEETTRRLVKLGVTLQRPVRQGADGNRQAWIEEPDGHRIELMQMAADSLQAWAIGRLRQA